MAELLEPRSQSVVDFARELRHRLLGNSDDQRVLPNKPDRLINFGIARQHSPHAESRVGVVSLARDALAFGTLYAARQNAVELSALHRAR